MLSAAQMTGAITATSLRATILVPTDAAFVALLSALGTTLPALLSNFNLLKMVVQYHVIPTLYANTTALAAAGTVNTLATGKTLAIAGSADSGITVTGETNTVNVVMTSTINGVYGYSTVRRSCRLCCTASVVFACSRTAGLQGPLAAPASACGSHSRPPPPTPHRPPRRP